jgi:hypothetical protein
VGRNVGSGVGDEEGTGVVWQSVGDEEGTGVVWQSVGVEVGSGVGHSDG